VSKLPPVSTTPAVLVAKFTASEYLFEVSKKFEMTLMLFSEAWGKMIHKKT
jgi:hypothetical protein